MEQEINEINDYGEPAVLFNVCEKGNETIVKYI